MLINDCRLTAIAMWRASRTIGSTVRSQGVLRCQGLSSETSAAAETQKTTSASTQTPASSATTTTQSKPPPPPQQDPPKKGGIFLKLVGLSFVGVGGAVGYALYDESARKQIEDKVPYSKEFFDYTLKYVPAITGAKKKSDQEPPAVGLAKVITPADPNELSKDDKRTDAIALTKAETKVPKDKVVLNKKSQDEIRAQKLKDEARKRMEAIKAEEAAENEAFATIVAEVLKETRDTIEQTIRAQRDAASATRAHNKQYKSAMDEIDPKSDSMGRWEEVAKAHERKIETVGAADKSNLEAQEVLAKLRTAIREGKSSVVTKKNKIIAEAEDAFNKLNYDVKSAVTEYQKAMSEAKLVEDYQDVVKQGKEKFKKELESIMPDVKMGSRISGKMSEQELNSLIAHAHRRIEQLQHQLAEQQVMEGQRMEMSMRQQRLEDEKISDERVGQEKEKLLAEFEIEKNELEGKLGLHFEEELRHQLARQAAAHSDHLAEVLRVQEEQLTGRFQGLLSDRVLAERSAMREEMSAWIAKLRGIESAVEARAEAEMRGRKAQELWLACQALQSLLVEGREGAVTPEQQVTPLGKEVEAVKEAGLKHPFVDLLVNNMPSEAVGRGVWTQSSLHDRFSKVRSVCRRVAMVDETNPSLVRYLLSYMQSMFVFTKARTLTESDLVQPSSLSTFALLDNANHCMERGDIEQALRYMNQLTGQARAVAADWIKETRLLLETKQAADALLAHASASGLGTLF